MFPAGAASGHLEESGAKIQHGDATGKLQAGKEAFDQWKKEGCRGSWEKFVEAKTKLTADYMSRHAKALCAGVKAFEPYCLRHTALTRLAEAGCDAFTLARIAGHSSITITQRYCHPQAEAVEAAFGRLGGIQTGKLMLPATIAATYHSEDFSQTLEVVEKMVSAEGIEPSTY